MTRHIVRRLLQAIPTIFGVTLLSYGLLLLAPGDPVALLTYGDPENISEVQMERLEQEFGLNDPGYIQYLRWLVGDDWMWWKNVDRDGDGVIDERQTSQGVLRGDFGNSLSMRGTSVMERIAQRLPATIELNIATLIVSFVLGMPIGIAAAITRGGVFDNSSRVLAVIGNAVPGFWLGLLLILVFSFNLGWLPSGDQCNKEIYRRVACTEVPLTERWQHLVLPTLVLSLGAIAGLSRYMRTSMLDTINSDYIRTAQAKGLPPRTVWFKHAARNALIPIATFLGPGIVSILGGAVVIEKVFNWPGIGLLALGAINARDYPLIMASVLIGAFLTVIGYILSDVLYAVFDPRIRF